MIIKNFEDLTDAQEIKRIVYKKDAQDNVKIEDVIFRDFLPEYNLLRVENKEKQPVLINSATVKLLEV